MGIFTGSYITTVICLLFAYFWGEHVSSGNGLTCVFIAAVLGVLEVSLSFDNAVVNAAKLEKMTEKWQKRFITWGIAIAVFGMRLLFPLLIVSIFAQIDFSEVLPLALNQPQEYEHYLHKSHASVVSFGGAFLIMLFLNYITSKREHLWIKPIERPLSKLSGIKYIDIFVTTMLICFTLSLNPLSKASEIFIPGIAGVCIFSLINQLANFIENKDNNLATGAANVAKGGFVSFLYLELIDASFSLDGVLGAFALSNDIIIISLGLCIGAIFVRSLTIMLVQKKTLKNFVYLEAGAHWAIAVLAIIMFVSTVHEIPEIITALSGLALILASLYSSVKFNKQEREAGAIQ